METHKSRPIPELSTKKIRKILAKISITTPAECWNWMGSKNRFGYGSVRLTVKCGTRFIAARDERGRIIASGKTGGRADNYLFKAHRVAWLIYKHEDPFPMEVLHKCDNPSCCNPDHLYVGTASQNMADKVKRGRQQKFGNQKLSADDVRAIRTRWASQKDLAEKYGVSQAQISAILAGLRWRSVV